MRAGAFDADRLGGHLRDLPDHPTQGDHVWEVLTVDVVDGRIQTVRIVRNPEKLGHL
jgi:RNA polymerase sigma-70 factor (ECF subfamily)